MGVQKKLILGLFFFSSIFKLIGQEIAVSFKGTDVLYKGIENPIKVVVENNKCKNVLVLSDSAMVTGVGCDYIVVAKGNEKVTLNVFLIKKKDTLLINKMYYDVIDIPTPFLTLGNLKNNSFVNRSELCRNSVLNASYENFKFSYRIQILEYNLKVLRKGEEILRKKIQGNIFDCAIINELKYGDSVIFTEVKAMIGSVVSSTKELTFFIID